MALTIREMVGPYSMVELDFGLAEGSVTGDADLLPSGAVGGSAAGVEAAWDGWIVGMSIQSEASANFVIRATVGGTAQTGTNTTVNAAAAYVTFDNGSAPSFSAGDLIGVECGTVTTAKDIHVCLYVVYNVAS